MSVVATKADPSYGAIPVTGESVYIIIIIIINEFHRDASLTKTSGPLYTEYTVEKMLAVKCCVL